jgi:hypothetical protein
VSPFNKVPSTEPVLSRQPNLRKIFQMKKRAQAALRGLCSLSGSSLPPKDLKDQSRCAVLPARREKLIYIFAVFSAAQTHVDFRVIL